MLREEACETCRFASPCKQYRPCSKPPQCPMYSKEWLVDKSSNSEDTFTHCKCLSVANDEPCPYYKEDASYGK